MSRKKFVETINQELTFRKKLKPLNDEQADFLAAIDENVIVLCLGSAGTGKTWCAIAKACEGLLEKKYSNVVISRPLVECDEKMGHLPGTIDEKIEPYVKLFYKTFREYFSDKELNTYIENDIISFCPLAYMRGMTFDRTFMVLDEAQNSSFPQLKMYLTRLGRGSKIVMTGDVTQSDLYGPNSYLKIIDMFDREPYVDGIEIVEITKVVRNDIIQKILDKFENNQKEIK